MGGATAPVDGSGSLPTWMARVAKPAAFFLDIKTQRIYHRGTETQRHREKCCHHGGHGAQGVSISYYFCFYFGFCLYFLLLFFLRALRVLRNKKRILSFSVSLCLCG